MRSSSASAIRLVWVAAHRLLDVRDLGTGSCVGIEGVVPATVTLPRGVEIEEREAVESFCVARRRADRKPDCDVSQLEWHAVRADGRRAVQHEPADQVGPASGDTSGQAAEQRMGDERGTLEVRSGDHPVEPGSERVDVQAAGRR
jgi:hypothetical protein